MPASANLPFPLEEYQERLAALRRQMEQRQVDLLLVDQVEHLGYLTGYLPTAARYQVAIVPLEGEPIMIVRGLDLPAFLEQSWLEAYVRFSDLEDSIEVLQRTLRARGLASRRIGLEEDSHFLLVKRYKAMQAALPEASFVDFSTVLWELRLRKSPREISYHRQAARIADASLLAGIEAAGVGRSEREAAAAVYATGIRLGADNTRLALIASGRRSDSLHGALGSHVLEHGDILHIETVPHYRGYTSRLMRSTVVGAPTPEQRDTASRLIAIQDEQLAAMRPGARASEIDRICRDGVLRAGLRDVYDNTTGYTLGYVSIPRTSDFTRVFLPDADWLLEPGMVFHMYTWARGLAFSDTVLITLNGNERLTQVDRKLFVRPAIS
jgi:Xaa-Pro dipeptidase